MRLVHDYTRRKSTYIRYVCNRISRPTDTGRNVSSMLHEQPVCYVFPLLVQRSRFLLRENLLCATLQNRCQIESFKGTRVS